MDQAINRLVTLVILTVLAFSQVSAQEWAPVGAEWRHSWKEVSGGQFSSYSMVRIEKDTVVEGQACRKYALYDQPVGEDRNVLVETGFTFERNDSVFLWLGDRFGFRYDFSAQVGDTISIQHDSILFTGYPSEGSISRVVLDSIREIQLGVPPVPLTKYFTHRVDGPFTYHDGGYLNIIGNRFSWTGLRYVGGSGPPTVGVYQGRVRCYTDAEQTIYLTDLNCSFPSNVEELNTLSSLRVYPNPSYSSTVTVALEQETLYHWELFNTQGQVQQSATGSWTGLQILNFTELPSGLYWLRLWLGDYNVPVHRPIILMD